MQYPTYKIFLTNLLNPKSDTKCDYKRDIALVLKRNSKGDYKIFEILTKKTALKKYETRKSVQIFELDDYILLPGLLDIHFHWVQDKVREKPKANLLNWLQKYTWPYEAKFESNEFSKNEAKRFSGELLRMGTLGGLCYSSIHAHTVDHAFDSFFGEFYMGNVLMTMNSPKNLTLTKARAKKLVSDKAKKYKNKYVITPRFAPTTDPDTMKEAGKIAKKNGCFIQSHLCETLNEINYVKEIYSEIKGFEKVETYTEIYHKCGLLGPKTVMGHGIYLSDKELKLLKKTKTAIAHCPTSNAPLKEKGLGSGLFDFKKVEKAGIPWGLASDIGGGPYLSMFDVMNSFVKQNRRKKIKEATYTKALYRATLKNAQIMQLDKKVGSFSEGKMGSFIAVKKPKNFTRTSSEKVLEKIVNVAPTQRDSYGKRIFLTVYNGHILYQA